MSPAPFYHGYESDEGRFHGNLRLWETHPTFRKICLESNLPALAQAFWQQKINLLYDQLFVGSRHGPAHLLAQRPALLAGPRLAGAVLLIALDKTTAQNGRLSSCAVPITGIGGSSPRLWQDAGYQPVRTQP